MRISTRAHLESVQLTGNDPSRMAESKAINQSLSVLGQVIHSLNQGAVRLIFLHGMLPISDGP